jgi:MFS family permease
VIGAIGALAWAGIPIGPILGGALADSLGLATTLWIGAGIYLVTTLIPFVFPVWAEMDRRGSPEGGASQAIRTGQPG